MLNATTATATREKGWWIRLNTTDERYEFTSTVRADWTTDPSQYHAINLGDRPDDSPTNPTPVGTATYTVASFHTHIPFIWDEGFRRVGPSPEDEDADEYQDVPGLVYDYVGGSEFSDLGGEFLYPGHDLSAAARLYRSGPERRSTP